MADVVAPTQINNDIETRDSADKEPARSDFWLGEIEAAKKREEPWWRRGQKVIDRYRDERNKEDGFEKRVNILWSNVEILKAALFSGMGQPDVRRRFPAKGAKERAARTAAIVLERSLSYNQDTTAADEAYEAAVEDHLLPGKGVIWEVYESEVDAEDNITSQKITSNHVYWRDFLTSFGRKWPDVWWVARRHLYSKDELKRYFPDDADKIALGADIEGAQKPKDSKDDTFKRAAVWEIWDKSKKERLYVAEGYDLVLKNDPDPYRLQDFFPCQSPLYAIKTTGSLAPIPEYTLYQDQAQELDRLTTRLDSMVEAIKRRGVYDASLDGGDQKLRQLMNAGDNEFLPYKGFAALMEKGGLKNVFQAEDIAQNIAAVAELSKKRAECIQAIYEVTGISDVVRGSTNPNETATAQRIKGQFGSMRIQKRQARVQRFVRDGYRIKAELIAEHCTREKLQEMSAIRLPLRAEIEMAKQIIARVQQQGQQMPPQAGHNGGPPIDMPGQPPQAPQQPPQQQMMPAPMPQPLQLAPDQMLEVQEVASSVPWEDVEAILRSDERRGYMVDVESDATAKVDDLEEKQARVEFVTSMQGMLEKSLPAAIQVPATLPLIKELVMFGVKTFKAGRQLEETFEDSFQRLGEMAQSKAGQPPPEDPAMVKVKADMERANQEFMLKQKGAEQDAQFKEREMQAKERQMTHEASMKEREMQHQMALKEAEMAFQARLEDLKSRMAHATRTAELEHGMNVEQYKTRSAASMKEMELNSQADLEGRRMQHQGQLEDRKLSNSRELAQMKATPLQPAGAQSQGVPQVAESAEAQEPEDAQMQQALMGIGQVLQQLAGQMEGLAASQQRLERTMKAPRKVMRDPTSGRVAGVQIVDDEQTEQGAAA